MPSFKTLDPENNELGAYARGDNKYNLKRQ